MHASCNCFLRKEISSICIATKNIATEAVIDVYENIAFMQYLFNLEGVIRCQVWNSHLTFRLNVNVHKIGGPNMFPGERSGF